MTSPAPRPGGGWQVAAGLAAVAVIGQLYGLYRVTGPPSPPWFPLADKAEHALGFALPVALVLHACARWAARRGARASRRVVVVVVAVFAAHGVVSELVQHVAYGTRTGDPLDVLADWAGTALGAAAWCWVMPRQAVAEAPVEDARRAPARAR